MKQQTYVDIVNDVIKLDKDKKYIIKFGHIKTEGCERWTKTCKHLIKQLKNLGLHNFIVAPHDMDIEVTEDTPKLAVGKIVYTLDPKCNHHKSIKRTLKECVITDIRKSLKKDGFVDERIVIEEIQPLTKWSKYQTSFKISSYHKTFFTDINEAKKVLGI